MNEFKSKKLAEFDNNFVDGNRCSQINENKNVNDIKQFISDLIDEMVVAIPEQQPSASVSEYYSGFNQCRETLINK